jgi:hypothetical protein
VEVRRVYRQTPTSDWKVCTWERLKRNHAACTVPTIAWRQGLLTGDDATSQNILFYCSQKKIQCSSVRIVTNLHAGHPRNRGFCKTSRSAMGHHGPPVHCVVGETGGFLRKCSGLGVKVETHLNIMAFEVIILCWCYEQSSWRPFIIPLCIRPCRAPTKFHLKFVFRDVTNQTQPFLLPIAVRDWSLKFHSLFKECPTYNQ